MNNWASALEIHHQQHDELVRAAAARSQARATRTAGSQHEEAAGARQWRSFWTLRTARLSA